MVIDLNLFKTTVLTQNFDSLYIGVAMCTLFVVRSAMCGHTHLYAITHSD